MRTIDLWSRSQDVVSKRSAGLLDKRGQPVTLALRAPDKDFAGSPVDIPEGRGRNSPLRMPVVESRRRMARSRTSIGVALPIVSMVWRTSVQESRGGKWASRQWGVLGTTGARSRS